ncbi:MAG: cytochrome c3 family protein [Deltaproteobacteria bacterium]|nr:cytochrome c3 family protein [Deltaproteobacteria bacterium]
MTQRSRRTSGVLALLFTTQVFYACNAGMRVSGEPGTVVAPTSAEGGAAEASASAPAAAAAKTEAAPASAQVAAAVTPEPSAEPVSSCVTAACHTKLLAGAELHPVAEDCETCHEAVTSPHPAKGKKTFKLTEEMPGLCNSCHDAFGKKKLVHVPVDAGMCTSCHNPHSSQQPKLLLQPVGELCKSCHEDHVDFKVLHGPVSNGECTACHTPHESDTATLLLREGADLCMGCHTDMKDVLKKKTVHAAVEAGCTSCHNPHGSKNAKLLSEPVPDLCFTCHTDIDDAIKEAKVPHPALDMPESCVSCHSPHSSDNDTLLQQPQKDVCLACHDTVASATMPVLHGPDNDGKCSRCHAPHGSKLEKLLVREFPADAYLPYTDTAYALCFGCHKRDLLQYPQTSFATNFRDGEKNLHYIHVNNKQKGRSCRLCHSWHGSKKPKLIADTVEFGQWKMQMKFVKTDSGGGCSPGCHNPRYYDRDSPGRKPAKASEAAGAN